MCSLTRRFLSLISNMSSMKFIDIGANLTDEMYGGSYHGSKKHEPDLDSVMQRCWDGGMDKMIITGGSLADCKSALRLADSDGKLYFCDITSIGPESTFIILDRLYATVGCHPTRCGEFEHGPADYLQNLKNIICSAPNKIIAVGECGLDYDRLKFCSKDLQKKYFEYQLPLSEEFNLPLFLHCRAAWDDFFDILSNFPLPRRGVVHSFDGSLENMKKAVDMGFYIGINGCSLKTEENLAVVSEIPLDKILIETDCPWCEIRPSHASAKYVKTQYPSVKKEKFIKGSMVKGRNEPINIKQIVEILAALKKADEKSLSDIIYQNTENLFFGIRNT